MPANLENSAVAMGLENVSFHSNHKERQCLRMLKLPHSCTHLIHELTNAQNSPSQASAIHEPWISRCSVGFRKGRGTRDQIANICLKNIEKTREFQKKTSNSALMTMPKPFTVWITINCGKILKEMGIPDHLTCLLRNLYVGQKSTVRTTVWSKSRKETVKAVSCHPVYLTYMQSTSCEMLDWVNHKLES